MRQYLDSLPCGALVLDERGTPVYQNEPLTKLLGRAVRTDETVENWLGAACPNDEHRQEIATLWREDVWRRQLTRIFSLATADGLLKELEFQPASLPGGGLLVCIQDATEPCRQEEQLRATEAKFRTLLHECPLPAVLVDKSGAVFEANHPAEILCGRSKADLRRLPLDSWLGEADAAARRRLLQQVVADGERSASLPVQLLHAEGHPVQVTLTLAPVLDARGAPHCAIHFFQKTEPSPAPAVLALPAALSNATAMSAAPQGLTASAFYQEVAATQSFEIREQSLLRTNVNGRIREITPRGLELLGLAEEEARGRALHLHFRPSDPSGFYSELGRLAQSGNAETEMACYTRQGDRQTCTLRVVSCGGGGLDFELTEVASVPVFEQAHAQVTAPAGAPWPLADLSREKLLLSETHHRIKNHLQIISSLLNLESNSIQDEGARCALRSSQNRVRAIAELHQHLYQVALGTAEDFSVFAEGLVQRLRACYQVPAGQVAVKLELEEGGIQQEWLMPLALTLNETLSNCFEHAFPEGRTGAVTVMLNFADGAGLLTVKDDGCGFPEGFEGAASPGLGLKIMGVFAEQMNGSLHYAPVQSGGVEVRLFFPLVASGS